MLLTGRPETKRLPKSASTISAVVTFRSTLGFISNLAALVPAECNDALQVSTLGEKSISECEVPPQAIHSYLHVLSSSGRPAMNSKRFQEDRKYMREIQRRTHVGLERSTA